MKTYNNSRPIAILLAVYNGEKYLREQIDSVIAQTNKDWTLYIRDDASTDSTLAIIHEYSERYDNIVSVEDEDGNLGCRGNFFRLLEVVESEYYMFCDGDDVWFDFKVQLTYDAMLKADIEEMRPVIVHTTWTLTDADLNVLVENYWKDTHFHPERYYSTGLIALATPVGGAEMMFNHYLKTLLFPLADNTLYHDKWIPMVAVRNNCKFIPLKVPTLFYRMHNNNACGINYNHRRSFFARIKGIWIDNKRLATRLKQAGYGSFYKYLYYKIIYIFLMKYDQLLKR